jgi:hypothetical protein
MEEEKNLENFDDFIQEVKEPADGSSHLKPETPTDETPIDNLNTVEETLCCQYCNYVPRKHAKDKQKSIKNHIKKNHPEKLNNFLTSEKTKKVNLAQTISDIDNASQIEVSEEDLKLKLVSDLDVIQAKFPTLWKCPSYSYPESSVEHLNRLKSTYTKLINDKLTNKLAFNTIVGVAKMGERVSDSLGICDLDGYAYNIQQNEEELLSIIDELIASQTLDMSMITPDVKLGICLLNIGIKTAESNKVKTNLNELS